MRLIFVAALAMVMGWGISSVSAAGPSSAQPVRDPLGASGAKGEMNCLALNIYWESRSEARAGQIAVAHVTLNRKAHPEFPDTVCGVVRQNGSSAPRSCQFSWWCDGKSDQPNNSDAWGEAKKLAVAVLGGKHPDLSKGALFFHHHTITPSWSKKKRFTRKIGDHLFYR